MTEPQQIHPIAGPQWPVAPPRPPVYQPVPVPARASRAPIVVAALTVLAVLALIGWQAYQISALSHRLSSAENQIQTEQVAGNTAVEAAASRIAVLEKAAFHPDLIAEAALPSVFRVKADGSSGTAWAVGKPTSSGGTNLFTNFHVVQSLWDKGGRTVTIEHRDQLYEATIVQVHKEKDVAQLETSAKFPGLKVSSEPVRPGEPIVVVGAPLGLESSVTTGVVSAFRKLEGSNESYVQFDAPINRGNSGGPVINSRGEVVGIASAKLKDAEGIGLAIPIGLACETIPICG